MATITPLGLIIARYHPVTGVELPLPAAVLRRFDVVNDGGILIHLDRTAPIEVLEVVAWLAGLGVTVHRVVHLPTAPTEPLGWPR
jgi:hypothetical protein